MGQILHGSATTTEAIRRAIQHSQESLRRLGEALRRQPEDSRQVESADLRFRSADRTEGAQIDGPVSRGRSRRRCIPEAYFAAARRLSSKRPIALLRSVKAGGGSRFQLPKPWCARLRSTQPAASSDPSNCSPPCFLKQNAPTRRLPTNGSTSRSNTKSNGIGSWSAG